MKSTRPGSATKNKGGQTTIEPGHEWEGGEIGATLRKRRGDHVDTFGGGKEDRNFLSKMKKYFSIHFSLALLGDEHPLAPLVFATEKMFIFSSALIFSLKQLHL